MGRKLERRRVALTFDDGTMRMMTFVTVGRGSFLPPGARWLDGGWWAREFTELNVLSELDRAVYGSETQTEVVDGVGRPKRVIVVNYRLLDAGDEGITDPMFRAARVHTGKAIEHDISKARDITRANLRHQRAAALPELDAKWMRATGQGKKAEADAIEAERQRWRDKPADPRITDAQTTEKLAQIVNGG